MARNETTRRRLAFFAAALALSLSSCGNLEAGRLYSKAEPLGKAAAAANMNPDTRRMLELAREAASFAARSYGLAEEEKELRYLPGSRPHLGWRLVVAAPLSVAPLSVAYFADEGKARAAGEKAASGGKAILLEPRESLRPLAKRAAPLLESFSAWPYERIVEWVNLQLFESAIASSKKAKELEGFAAFAAEEATVAFLKRQLSPSSPILGRYIAEKRDERAFAALFPDYRSRFEGLYAQKPLPEDWEKRREFLSRTWLQDYWNNYPNRFLTNRFRDFGRKPPTDVELAAWSSPFAGREGWERRYREAGEDLSLLMRQAAIR